ncbi:MAG TPA: glycoside hydrolase family 2 TIM barrel-domain containing protein [Solirubrobacteraceae bacterium]|nr:glycoside hydrolase family 2 TIM barrel-domain containing protein [Solirubrobacteraceae bacterium]
MPARPRTLALLAVATIVLLAVPAGAGAAERPERRALTAYGPDNRHLLDGEWLFRLDEADQGLKDRWQRRIPTTGWSTVEVPDAWNAGDESNASMVGTVGWYRKDFRLPSRSERFEWTVRFESVNYRARAWLNGEEIGRNSGAYLPFELRIPADELRRSGTNRLVVRVDNRRLPTDFPPSGINDQEIPVGGWWNYGGLLREVYLKRIDRVSIERVDVRPELKCATCDATVRAAVTVRNFDSRTRGVTVTGSFGGRDLPMGTRRVRPGRAVTFIRRIAVRDPRLWSPDDPNLYSVRFRARALGIQRAEWRLKSGIRSVTVEDGLLMLNHERVNLRGFGLHEDDRELGFAIPRSKMRLVGRLAKELGGTIVRAHYPLHPYFHEYADRIGLMVWSEVPIYALKTQALAEMGVRDAAVKLVEANVRQNASHPSVALWSIGNELSARPGPVQEDYLRRAARAARRLDPGRPVGYAVNAYPAAGCQEAYAELDVLGFNDYFGWYPGPGGQVADREDLSPFLDSVRACYPEKAIVVSEFGAEANRPGPVEEKGTFAHQQDFVNFHSDVYDTKAWLSGAMYWALQEFRVRPGWDGGNPRPTPPIHTKGLITFDGWRKPAADDVQRRFSTTQQFGTPR